MNVAHVPLSELCEDGSPITYGILQPGPDLPDGVPYVRPSEIKGGEIDLSSVRRTTTEIASKYKKSVIRSGDILITIVGTIGHIAVVPPELEGANITQSSARIRIAKDVADRVFIKHFLRSDLAKRQYDRHRLGVAVPRLNLHHVRDLKIPLPPIEEQKRIAGILDAADELRTKRRESLAQLDALLQSTFLDMFGDPVTNPKGWDVGVINDVVETGDKINYGVVQPGDHINGGFPLIRVGDFVSGDLNLSKLKYISPAIDRKYSRSKLTGSEILISCVGSIGNICKVPSKAIGHNIARAVARVPLIETVDRDFMIQMLRTKPVQNYFFKETRTVSQPTLNISMIKSAPILNPPRDLQIQFAEFAQNAEAQWSTYREQASQLDTLFASLQSRAFRGKL